MCVALKTWKLTMRQWNSGIITWLNVNKCGPRNFLMLIDDNYRVNLFRVHIQHGLESTVSRRVLAALTTLR